MPDAVGLLPPDVGGNRARIKRPTSPAPTVKEELRECNCAYGHSPVTKANAMKEIRGKGEKQKRNN